MQPLSRRTGGAPNEAHFRWRWRSDTLGWSSSRTGAGWRGYGVAQEVGGLLVVLVMLVPVFAILPRAHVVHPVANGSSDRDVHARQSDRSGRAALRNSSSERLLSRRLTSSIPFAGRAKGQSERVTKMRVGLDNSSIQLNT